MIKFRSRVTGDVIMLDESGHQILKILGKFNEGAAPKGILTPAEMADAIAKLQDAVTQEEAGREQLVQQAQVNGEAPPRFEGITLRQRTQPLISMFERCMKADKEVVWGV